MKENFDMKDVALNPDKYSAEQRAEALELLVTATKNSVAQEKQDKNEVEKNTNKPN